MSIRSRFFATVALPVFAASLAVQPALADSLKAPFEMAQEGGELSPEELLLLKKRKKQRAAEEESQGQAERQQGRAEERQRSEEKARRRAERAAEQEAQQAEEQQRGLRKKRQAEKQRAAEQEAQQAEEQQRAVRKKRQAEKQRAAEQEAQQAEEQQRAVRKKRQAEKQRAAEQEAQQAEERQRALRKKRQAEKQRAAEQEAQQAEEQQKAVRKKRQAEEQRAAEQEAQQAEERQRVLRKKRQAEKQRAAEQEAQQAEEQQKAVRKKREAEAQRAAEQEAQQAEDEQRALRKKRQAEKQRAAEQEAQQAEEQQRALRKKREAATQRAAEEEMRVAPDAEEPAAAERIRAKRGVLPVPEVVDERTEEERLKIAEDPASTDETIVLPVERGAAVLDSDKDADNISGNRAREVRRKQREELRAREEQVAPPTDDAAAQMAIPAEIREELPQRIEALLSEEGERFEEAPAFAVPETTNIVNNTMINNTVINNTTINQTTETNVTELRVVEEVDDRVILGAGDRIFVRGDDRPRLRQHAEETYYDNLSGGRVRETIVRPDGYRIVTVYNRYGDIQSRTRVDRDGNEYVMIYAPDYQDRRRPAIFDVGYELPPMRLTIPVDEYIVDYADDPDRDYYAFLSEPPVEPVERVYTIDEVRYSARLRDKVRRIDLDTIHFATGSAEVSMSQARTLRNVALAMEKILARDPGETFFIEGHTDAVGSDQSNLVLSDRRAEGVAVLLTEVYGIPAENLVTQGYGERFLKIRTPEAEEENRRVTIRRVTPLVRPVAQR
ncbi:OmpA family protein [Sinorhizobium alkalisoli]|uniref:OmpA family protein n=1 Tax=Sinorhizobium alkalisoli TaxID=1752398 RepID=UPI00124EAD00|nr:OmpA family protein [Sinorhizobium alkalisoli]